MQKEAMKEKVGCHPSEILPERHPSMGSC